VAANLWVHACVDCDADDDQGISEGGDDLNCTQIGDGEINDTGDKDDDDWSDEDDDDVPLTSLVKGSQATVTSVMDLNARIPSDTTCNASCHEIVLQQSATAITHTISTSNKRDPKLMTCFVCGASLGHIQSGFSGRVNHIKRCSKKHGLQAKDMRRNDDFDHFVPLPLEGDDPAKNTPKKLVTTTWHGDASLELAVAAATTNGKQTDSVATDPEGMDMDTPTDSHAETDLPSINSVLLAGAAKQQAAAGRQPPPQQPPSALSVLMAGARRAAKVEKRKEQMKHLAPKKGGWRGNSYYSNKDTPCPAFKKIPGTDFGEYNIFSP
jgi:hypothetical protein